jgi:protein-L-isoaspartate(D-aspartate) O-methyltransferase
MNFVEERNRMVELQLVRRGIKDSRVLEAFRTVPREAFVPPEMAEFAYRDSPLPIGGGQTISQPYIVALTTEALLLRGDERVLEIGAGSGYAAAILSRCAKEVYTIDRIRTLAEAARERLTRLRYDNVHVISADGTLGWPDKAPYGAIAVAAGGPELPRALMSQLTLGGRLVIPVGREELEQVLVRVVRENETKFTQEAITEVRFVPLIGAQGWPEDKPLLKPAAQTSQHGLTTLVRENLEAIEDLDEGSLDALLDRLSSARVVLLGESTHGTSEFYRLRARITQALIERGFDFVATEADWPDAARVDNFVLGEPPRRYPEFTPFSRFPTWMWRNEEVNELIGWMRTHNLSVERERRVGFHGLDLYSMFTSIAAVLAYLDDVDPDAARVARTRYGTLTPWQQDPAAYGRAVLVGKYESSEHAVVAMLRDMLERRIDYARSDGDRFFDAAQNAVVVTNCERYYRAMYYGAAASWNLRDTHMFETLESLLSFYGPESRAIVWEHNSHVGNALATEMSLRGELNVGQLCRAKFGERAYVVGFATDHGTVAAASEWDAPMQIMQVRPGHPESYERLFHEVRPPAFMLPFRHAKKPALREELGNPKLERAIGVVYRPDSELASHYFYAAMPQQFDELIWIDETHAVQALETRPVRTADLPETYPFGL